MKKIELTKEELMRLVYIPPEDPEQLLKGKTSEEILKEAIQNFGKHYEL